MSFFKTGKSPVISVAEKEKEVKTKEPSAQTTKEDKKDNKKK